MENIYPNLWTNLLNNSRFYSDKPFITFGREALSYELFCERTYSVAGYLNSFSSSEIVGINLNHPFDIIISMIGVLISEKAFWVVNSELIESIEDKILNKVYLLNASEFEDVFKKEIKDFYPNPTVKASKIFCWTTSSGRLSSPKITEHNYFSIIEDIKRQVSQYKIQDTDKIDILSTISFSASLSTIFPALFSGASIHIKPKSDDMFDIFNFWKSEGITMTTMIPSLFRMLLQFNENLKNYPLRFICLGGENVRVDDINLFKSRFNSDVICQAALASSETRMIAEYIAYPDNKKVKEFLYTPVENKKIRILDDNLKELKYGEKGRISVQSSVIGNRYINSFKSFSRLVNNERLFVSDDFGIMNPDGTLKVANENNRRIKIKGEFVDLDHIEGQITKITNVNEVCVKYDRSDSRIEIYISSNLEKSELRPHISKLLQEFPFLLFLSKDSLKRLDSGKLDLQKMKDSALEIINPSKNEPRNPIKKIWSEFFPDEDQFKGKHFFKDLGGDSFLGAQFAVEATREFRKKISSSVIYSFPVYDDLINFFESSESLQIYPLSEIDNNLENVLIFPWFDGSHHIYEKMIISLKDKFNFFIITIDIGEMKSLKTINQIVHDSLMIIVNSGITFSIFMGHSFSGILSYLVASKSNSVENVILFDTPIYKKTSSKKRIVSKLKRFYSKKQKLSWIRRELALAGLSIIANNRENIRFEDIEKHKFMIFYRRIRPENISIPNTNFNLGLFIASDQNFFNSRLNCSFEWENFNSNVLFSKVLEGDHRSIMMSDHNIYDIKLELNKYFKN